MPSSDSSPGSGPSAGRPTLTVKQQRDERRAAKVAQLKKQQSNAKRNRRIGIIVGSVAVVSVVGLIIGLVVSGGSSTPVASGPITGLKTFSNLTQNHVAGTVTYEQSPPVGGDHAAQWLNCGVYTEAVPKENAVHALEHGAVWVTYNPDEVTGDALAALQDAVPETYSVLSPWTGLSSPVVISAWGAQVALDGSDDPRLAQFVDEYWQSPDAPEPGAPCVGGIDGSGKIA